MKKITIIGAGRVGESTAQMVAARELVNEVALVDIREGMAAGIALDIQESCALQGFDTRLVGGMNPELMEDSGIVVVTAGQPRKPGMSRSDVLEANLTISRSILKDIMDHAPDAIIVMVTNPVDIMTYDAWQSTGLDRRRVFGLSGVLDSARMASFIAVETGLSALDIYAVVLGGHGDAMVPLVRYSHVGGIPLDQLLGTDRLESIIERTRHGGAEILALKKTASANDAPAASITTMVEAVVRDRRRVLPCVAILDGEYGLQDIAMGVPVVLSGNGIERVIELKFNDDEAARFAESVAHIRDDISRITELPGRAAR